MDDVNTYTASLNKYAYPPLSYNLIDPTDQTQLSAKLCEIALMEGWHDHNDILNTTLFPNRIRNAVIAYTPPGPPGCTGDARYHSEEKYLTYVLTKDPRDMNEAQSLNTNWKKGPNDTLYMQDADWQGIFNERIREKYAISRVVLTKNKDNHSRVQKCFYTNGITQNIYILRDVAYGCWADDIRKWGRGLENGENGENEESQAKRVAARDQYIYNVQTSSGIYDPGPSLSYFSGAGERCGYQDTPGKSRYGLFDCSFPDEIVVNYPAYIPNDPITCAEQLIYTKYKCTLFGDNTTKIDNATADSATADNATADNATAGVVTKKAAEKMIESAAVNLIVEVPVLDASGNIDARLVQYPDLYLVTKHNSQKASSLFDLPLISSCIKYSARKDMIDIASNIYKFEEYNVITGSSPLKIMTKKFGDSGIAIQTLRPKLHFYEFEPQSETDNVKLIKRESNGIQAFLTFDQVAAAAAIEYGVPIVIYNTQDYAMIFISMKLKSEFETEDVKLEQLRKSIKDPFESMNTEDATTAATTAIGDAASDSAAAATAATIAIEGAAAAKPLATRIGNNINDYIRTSSQSDINYGVYLNFWYKLGPFVKIYNDTLKTNDKLNATRDDIIVEYSRSKSSAAAGIDSITDLTQLTEISNAYRNYNNMILAYASVTAAFSQVSGSTNILINTPKKIKIGDVSKIIDNCDPFKGTVKEQRIRKLFTCLRGQSPLGIELGITVIIQIYENLSGSPPIQNGFKNQIISLFQNIAETCKEELKQTLSLAFDFIPSEYKDIFVSQTARGYVNPPMIGGAIPPSPINSLSTDKSTIQNTSNTEKGSQMFDDVIDKLTEIITYLDETIKDDKTKDTDLLENIKLLLEATKGVIEIQGTKYIKTLNSPLSYEHLEADAFVHQPLFIYTVLQTILEYNSATATIEDTESQVLEGGDKRKREDDPHPILDDIFNNNTITRGTTSPYRKGGMIEEWLANRKANYPKIRPNLLNLPDNYIEDVFLLNTSNFEIVNLALENILDPTKQYIFVYGYVVEVSRLVNIIKSVAINNRSVETKNEDIDDLKDNFSYDSNIVIDDVTTSSSITESIMVRNDKVNDQYLFDKFIVFANRVKNRHTQNIINSTNEAHMKIYTIDLYDRLIEKLGSLTQELQTRLDQSQPITDINELLTTIFPTTFISPAATTTGGRHKKTRRKQKMLKTSKYKKTRRKRTKSKGRQTTKRKPTPKVRKPRKTRP